MRLVSFELSTVTGPLTRIGAVLPDGAGRVADLLPVLHRGPHQLVERGGALGSRQVLEQPLPHFGGAQVGGLAATAPLHGPLPMRNGAPR